jgi:hypothetical protein
VGNHQPGRRPMVFCPVRTNTVLYPAILNMEIRFSDAAPCPAQRPVIVNKSFRLDAPGWGSWGGRLCSARRASIIVMLAAVPDGAFIESPLWQTIFGPTLDDKLRLWRAAKG